MSLTNVTIRNAKPRQKAHRLFDGRGLYLEVSPNGGKWWRLKFRCSGKEKRLSLGVYPEVGLELARERREAARKLLAAGIDPSETRRAEKSTAVDRVASTFEVVTYEWIGKYSNGWVPSHAVRVKRLFERDVFPRIGSRPISEILSPEVLAVARLIERRGALDTAHRAVQSCGQVFRYAIATGRATTDPTGALRGALPPVRGGHFAAATEPIELGRVLRAIDDYSGTPAVSSALRLAPLVFVRPGELRHAEWKDIDLETFEWRYTVSKTKVAHIVPLSRQAAHILRQLWPVTGGGRFLFPSAKANSRPMSDNAVLAAMRRMGIEKERMSGHGFRAAARTILDEVLGVRSDLIEHQLAHAVRDPNGRAYNRTAHLPERVKMMQTWADYLDELKRGYTALPRRTLIATYESEAMKSSSRNPLAGEVRNNGPEMLNSA